MASLYFPPSSMTHAAAARASFSRQIVRALRDDGGALTRGVSADVGELPRRHYFSAHLFSRLSMAPRRASCPGRARYGVSAHAFSFSTRQEMVLASLRARDDRCSPGKSRLLISPPRSPLMIYAMPPATRTRYRAA